MKFWKFLFYCLSNKRENSIKKQQQFNFPLDVLLPKKSITSDQKPLNYLKNPSITFKSCIQNQCNNFRSCFTILFDAFSTRHFSHRFYNLALIGKKSCLINENRFSLVNIWIIAIRVGCCLPPLLSHRRNLVKFHLGRKAIFTFEYWKKLMGAK